VDAALRTAFVLLDAVERRCLAALSPALTVAQFYALAALMEDPDESLIELSRRLLCAKANASGIVDRLETMGLVTCRPNKADRRRLRIRLSPQGAEVFRVAQSARAAAVAQAFAKADPSDLLLMTAMFDRVVALLQNAVECESQPEGWQRP